MSDASRRELRRPRPLPAGSRVALVAPSSPLAEPEQYRIAEEIVRSLDWEPVWMPAARDRHGYLAGEDAARAADLVAAFRDPGIDGLWCLRGGYGALRIVDRVPWEELRENPKVLLGYSDVTVLLSALLERSGVVGFHGPIAGSDLDPFAVSELLRLVREPVPAGRIGAPPAPPAAPGQAERTHRLETLVPGAAEGRLVGGNLSLVTRLLGTPYAPRFDGRLLFLEEVGEATYRIDGMLQQLRLAGVFERVAGVVLGRFTESPAGGQPSVLPLGTVFAEIFRDVRFPVFRGFRCGHVSDQTTVPVGVLARMDADRGTLQLLEAAVSAT